MTKHWRAVPISAFHLADPVFALRQEICSKVTIPSSLKRCEETGRLAAFRLDWHPGMPNRPHIYWDSDVAKVLEGMAYDVELHTDEKHLSRLNKLVELICHSQRSLFRYWQESFPMPPMQYIQRQKIKRAEYLHKHTVLTISSIARQLGFCDGNYFSARFLKQTGMTPRDYRRQEMR